LDRRKPGLEISEQSEREGKAPSGSAGEESEDRAWPVRARGLGASEERRHRTGPQIKWLAT